MKTLGCVTLTLLMLSVTVVAAFADIRIQLVQGRRAVRDQVSFTIEVSHETNENPRYAKLPEFIEISTGFAAPASGTISIDGRGIGRFDDVIRFNTDRTEITYGEHVVTLDVSAPAVVTSFVVFVRGGVPREIVGRRPTRREASEPTPAANLEDRVAELERRVRQLEAELADLKRARRIR